MTTLILNQVYTDILEPDHTITVSGACVINVDVEGTVTKKTLAATGSFVFEHYLIPIRLEVTALGDVTITNSVNTAPHMPSEFLSTQYVVETEYLSPDQHGGYYGTVYRQYHGAKLTTETITTTGITKLIAAGGSYETIYTYNGSYNDGTNSILIAKGTDQVVVTIAGAGVFTLDSGWIDYIK